MARFKRESWVKKMQDDFSDAYPTRPVYTDSFETTYRDYANWSDPHEVEQKTRESEGIQTSRYTDAVEYKRRSHGHVASANKVQFTPYVSQGGYTHDYSYNYQPLDTQTRLAAQNYCYNPPALPTNTQLTARKKYQPLSDQLKDIQEIPDLSSRKVLPPLAKSARLPESTSGLHMYSRLLTKAQSGPALTYKRKMLLKANPHLTKEDFEKAGLLPPPSRSSMQELLGVTYKDPWRHFNVLK